jgi:hypothetical protein
MTVVELILGGVLLIVWTLTLVDIFRRHYSGWMTVGYIALIVILPFFGSAIYWAVRKPSREEAERAYLAQEDVRRSAASRPFDSTGMY